MRSPRGNITGDKATARPVIGNEIRNEKRLIVRTCGEGGEQGRGTVAGVVRVNKLQQDYKERDRDRYSHEMLEGRDWNAYLVLGGRGRESGGREGSESPSFTLLHLPFTTFIFLCLRDPYVSNAGWSTCYVCAGRCERQPCVCVCVCS